MNNFKEQINAKAFKYSFEKKCSSDPVFGYAFNLINTNQRSRKFFELLENTDNLTHSPKYLKNIEKVIRSCINSSKLTSEDFEMGLYAINKFSNIINGDNNVQDALLKLSDYYDDNNNIGIDAIDNDMNDDTNIESNKRHFDRLNDSDGLDDHDIKDISEESYKSEESDESYDFAELDELENRDESSKLTEFKELYESEESEGSEEPEESEESEELEELEELHESDITKESKQLKITEENRDSIRITKQIDINNPDNDNIAKLSQYKDKSDIFASLCYTLDKYKDKLSNVIINSLCIVEISKGKIIPMLSISNGNNSKDANFYTFDNGRLMKYDKSAFDMNNVKELYWKIIAEKTNNVKYYIALMKNFISSNKSEHDMINYKNIKDVSKDVYSDILKKYMKFKMEKIQNNYKKIA